ncbi:MAG: hypothetical protein AAGD23_02335 [Pseudomonadota bacterium]
MQLIEQWLGVDFSQPMEFIIAFVVVMVLIALVTLIVRGLMFRGGDGFRGRAQKRQRLFVGEWVRVDEKRRLLLVRRDEVEHLLLIGGNSDLVVEQDVSSKKPQTLPVATVQAPAAQPDVYTPPEEPRIPTTDPGYRSPLRTGAAPAAAPAALPIEEEEPVSSEPEVAVETAAGEETPSDPDPKLTGLQAARARIAALRRKSAEISTSNKAMVAGSAAGAVSIDQTDDSEAASEEPEDIRDETDIPPVAAVDLDEAIAEALAPEISVNDDTDDEAEDHLEPQPGTKSEIDDRPGAANDDSKDEATEPREDDLAARLHDVLIKPA